MSGMYTYAANTNHAAIRTAITEFDELANRGVGEYRLQFTNAPAHQLSQYLLGDCLQLQVGRALVNLADFRVAVQLLDGVVLDEAVAAEEIDRERRHPLGDFGREDLAHRRFGEERQPGIAQPCGVVHHQPRALDVGRGARELVLHRLELRDRFAELPAILRVLNRVVERALGESHHLRADADAPFVQRLDRDLVAFADLAEDARPRDGALLEDQLAGAAGADAQLVFLLADRKPRRAALHEKRGD